MSIQVRVPTILRDYTSGAKAVEASGGTVSEVLADLERRFPGIKSRITDENGALLRYVNVYVGDDDIRSGHGIQTPTPDGAVLSLLPAVAGG
jgi:molybdopterin synthase sulfur carrier subunit